MKFNQALYRTFLAKPNPKIKAILVYGPDEGAVHETALELAKTVVNDLKDPFRVTSLTPASFKNTPSILLYEASAIPLMGGRKLILINEADNNITNQINDFINLYNGDSFVVISAGNLLKTSSLRKLAESSENMAAISCYSDDNETLKKLITEQLKINGKKISLDAINWLTENLGADRAITRNEISKLITFIGDKTDINLEDVMNIIGDGSATSMEDLIFATGEGNFNNMNKALNKIFYEDENAAVSIIRATIYHFQRLHLVKTNINNGMRGEEALHLLFPPINFKREPSFKKQIQIWSPEKIFNVLKLLVDTEKECKTTGTPAELICSRTLMQITLLANK